MEVSCVYFIPPATVKLTFYILLRPGLFYDISMLSLQSEAFHPTLQLKLKKKIETEPLLTRMHAMACLLCGSLHKPLQRIDCNNT